ncbi:MAG: type II toxin-antitoxin system RelE/ParE family toxin [Oscillospiraceae bacterium]|jgi:plasmid stabilization system protein ParE|nr:type II toxin-antitoxin system RelE/ParE family toxin [Oscillospiraceae bacterium]
MYDVVYLPTARGELRETLHYIATELLAPDASVALAHTVDDAVQKLAYMPYRHPVYHATDDIEREIRLLVVKNYNIYYAVNEGQKTVEITHVVYGRRIIF